VENAGGKLYPRLRVDYRGFAGVRRRSRDEFNKLSLRASAWSDILRWGSKTSVLDAPSGALVSYSIRVQYYSVRRRERK